MNYKEPKVKIGIMGGAFNPIHYGHLMLAEQVRTKFDLDLIYFIPSGDPPHKVIDGVIKNDRYIMTVLATSTNPNFLVSDIELKKVTKTYTVDTIRELKEIVNPQDEMYFITGADAIIALDTWKDYKELLKSCRFIAATRPEIDTTIFEEEIERFNEELGCDIEMITVPALAISSTDIRQRVFESRSIKYLLPESVEEFILKKELYRDAEMVELEKMLMHKLSEKRFNHCMRVKKEAENLAIRYNVSVRKAKIAALLHDYAKHVRDETILTIMKSEGLEIDESIVSIPNIAHGEVAAVLIKKDLGIDDSEILEAIKWHTYGKRNMTTFEKIIFIADAIEPGRNYDGIDRIREATYKELDRGILMYLDNTIDYLSKINNPIHKNTMELREQLREKEEIEWK